MLIHPKGGAALRGDLIRRVILRSDLAPIPATVEVEARAASESEQALRQDAVIEVGAQRIPMRIIMTEQVQGGGAIQGDREVAYIRATGLLDSCAPVAQRLQRAIVREGASLGEIYRACGANVAIDSDFTVPVWSCFVGMTPSFEIAKALQEEAGALLYAGGRVQFRRLRELVAQKPQQYLDKNQTAVIESGFLERHSVPYAFTTSPSGAFVLGRREAARGVHYRPRGDERIVRSLATALVARRTYRNVLTTSIGAGERFDVEGVPMVVITAAHVFEAMGSGIPPEQYSKFWLGELIE